MNMSKWTRVLLGAGLISLPAAMHADEASQTNAVLTALSSTTLSGYIDTSATWTFQTGNGNMPGRVYDGPDTQDAFNLNVVSLTLDKPLDDSLWASGYHVQMLMGPGASKRGTGIIASSGSTDFSFNEAYVALRLPVGNGVDLHIGQFGTYNGYEAYDTYKDPNWSRSYGFYIESSAHTGISASYAFSDAVSLSVGVGNEAGFNNQVDAKSSIESRKAYHYVHGPGNHGLHERRDPLGGLHLRGRSDRGSPRQRIRCAASSRNDGLRAGESLHRRHDATADHGPEPGRGL
jgi:hypothetical protein